MASTYKTPAPCHELFGTWKVVASDANGAFAINASGRLCSWTIETTTNACKISASAVWRALLGRDPAPSELHHLQMSLYERKGKQILHLQGVPGGGWRRSPTPDGARLFMHTYRKQGRGFSERNRQAAAAAAVVGAGFGLGTLALYHQKSARRMTAEANSPQTNPVPGNPAFVTTTVQPPVTKQLVLYDASDQKVAQGATLLNKQGMGTWFQTLFGSHEYNSMTRTQQSFTISGTQLIAENKQVFEMGTFTTPTVKQLVDWAEKLPTTNSPLLLHFVQGDVSELQADPKNNGAMFQVASQFNCLEFVGPSVTPEQGIGVYAGDHTQGPACSIGAAAGTLYRNYFVPMPSGKVGQSEHEQINNLAGIKAEFKEWFDDTGGYTIASAATMQAMNTELSAMEREPLMLKLRVGLHLGTQVTSSSWGKNVLDDKQQRVSQLFGSACSVTYSNLDTEIWRPFASMIQDGCYLATVAAALLNRAKFPDLVGSNKLYLTMVGGGAFGNDQQWILDAMHSALFKYRDTGLEVYIVYYYRDNIKPYQERLREFVLN
jgi:hypothetical protein